MSALQLLLACDGALLALAVPALALGRRAAARWIVYGGALAACAQVTFLVAPWLAATPPPHGWRQVGQIMGEACSRGT